MIEAYMKAAHAQATFDQRASHLGHLPGPILRDIARNDSAPREWRKAAIELMLDKGFKEVNHPDLALLLLEVNAHREAKDEVQAIVESAIEAPLEDHDLERQEIADIVGVPLEQIHKLSIPPTPLVSVPIGETLTPLTPETIKIPESLGPFKASFTTQSQYQDEVV